MSQPIPDGQNRHDVTVNVMSCFFCLHNKRNCLTYLPCLKENPPEIIRRYVGGKKFVVCRDCLAKNEADPLYLAGIMAEYAVNQDKIAKMMLGLRDD